MDNYLLGQTKYLGVLYISFLTRTLGSYIINIYQNLHVNSSKPGLFSEGFENLTVYLLSVDNFWEYLCCIMDPFPVLPQLQLFNNFLAKHAWRSNWN